MSGDATAPFSDTQAVFRKLRSLPENKTCFDCPTKNPTWCTIPYGAFVCLGKFFEIGFYRFFYGEGRVCDCKFRVFWSASKSGYSFNFYPIGRFGSSMDLEAVALHASRWKWKSARLFPSQWRRDIRQISQILKSSCQSLQEQNCQIGKPRTVVKIFQREPVSNFSLWNFILQYWWILSLKVGISGFINK